MYTVTLKPTDALYADEIADKANNWLSSCIGICEDTPEKALQKAENELSTAFQDEVGVYYNIEVTELDIEE